MRLQTDRCGAGPGTVRARKRKGLPPGDPAHLARMIPGMNESPRPASAAIICSTTFWQKTRRRVKIAPLFRDRPQLLRSARRAHEAPNVSTGAGVYRSIDAVDSGANCYARVPLLYPELEVIDAVLFHSKRHARRAVAPRDHPVVTQGLLSKESPRGLWRRGSLRDQARREMARQRLWTRSKKIGAWTRQLRSHDSVRRACGRRRRPATCAADEDDNSEARLARRGKELSGAAFTVYGTNGYHDATFQTAPQPTGVQGMCLENGHAVEPFTQLGRAFERRDRRLALQKYLPVGLKAKERYEMGNTLLHLDQNKRHRKAEFRAVR